MSDGYDKHLRTLHQVDALHGSTPRSSHGMDPAGQVHVLATQQGRPRRDGTPRTGTIGPLDEQSRIMASKAVKPLGWEPTTPLVATARGAAVVVREGRPGDPTQTPVAYCRDGRLKLAGVSGVLGVTHGDQVLAVAVPSTGELHLVAAADVLQQVTGFLEPPSAPALSGAEADVAKRAAGSKVRPRWKADGA